MSEIKKNDRVMYKGMKGLVISVKGSIATIFTASHNMSVPVSMLTKVENAKPDLSA